MNTLSTKTPKSTTPSRTPAPKDAIDAKVTVLSEYVKHHVKEEQNEMFPKAKAATSLDMVELGQALSERKAALLAQHD